MSKKVFIVLGIVIISGIGVRFLFSFYGPTGLPRGQEKQEMREKQSGMIAQQKSYTTPSGLKIEILQEGNGGGAKAGNTVSVHYVGTLTNGTKFDSSRDRGEPISFILGEGRVIKGWEEGILGMKVGEKRRLTIPPELGYGARGAGDAIPPNATLIFETEMMAIE